MATVQCYLLTAASWLKNTECRLFGDEAVDVCRKFAKLKLRCTIYLSNGGKFSSYRSATMRSMVMEFEDDPATKYLDMQYMLGDNILVAPVFSADGDVGYYIPEGT
ncbi:MAG: hypothetical protein ACLTCI_07600 [[Clostridium] nexile]